MTGDSTRPVSYTHLGSHVDGVLWSLTGDCEKSLDLYEGYPDFYDKQEITVKNKGGREIKALSLIHI